MKVQDKVHLLADALNYVRRYAGKTIVVKYGGNVGVDESLAQQFARDLALLAVVGIKPVVVHGGGPQINENLRQLNIESRFVNGLRYTDAETMSVVERVLGGEVNQKIVQNINQHGARAAGLTGKDDGLILARPLTVKDEHGADISLGQVGEIIRVKKDMLMLMQESGIIPVIAPIACDDDNTALNVNADTAAAEIAIALGAEALFLLTNTAGVLDENKQLLTRLTAAQVGQKVADGTISDGMKPKTDCAIHAVKNGVRSCRIIDGRVAHALLLELFTDEGAGTFIEDDNN